MFRLHLFIKKQAHTARKGSVGLNNNVAQFETHFDSGLFSVILRSGNGHKAACPGDDHIVRAAGAVNHQQISGFVSSTDDANMRIVRVKYQVTGPGVLPAYIGAIAVLHGGPAAMSDDIASACGIVKGPIDKARAVQPVGPVGAGGEVARRRDLPQLSPAGVPAENKALAAPKVGDLAVERQRVLHHGATLR